MISLRGSLKIKNSNQKPNIVEKPIVNVETLDTEVKTFKEGELYALPISNGYKIVDSAPTVIYLIHTTSNESVFIASKGEVKGVFMKKINGWFFDYYQNDILSF